MSSYLITFKLKMIKAISRKLKCSSLSTSLHFCYREIQVSNLKFNRIASTLHQPQHFGKDDIKPCLTSDACRLYTVSNFDYFNCKFQRHFSNQSGEWEDLKLNKNLIKDIPIKKENIYTIPNLISCCRIAVTPYIGYLVVHQAFSAALGIVFIAGLSDLADGYIARRWPSQQSAVGSALDPLADKAFISVLAVSLTSINILPVALTALFISRDLLLIGAVFCIRYRTCPPPVTLKRYFDPTLVNAKLTPTAISKFNTLLQMSVIVMSVASPVFGYTDHVILKGFWLLSAATTIASAVDYLRRKDTISVLKGDGQS